MSVVSNEKYAAITLKNKALLILDITPSSVISLSAFCQNVTEQFKDIVVAGYLIDESIKQFLTEFGWQVLPYSAALQPTDISELQHYYRCDMFFVYTTLSSRKYWQEFSKNLPFQLQILTEQTTRLTADVQAENNLALSLPAIPKTRNLSRMLNEEQRQQQLYTTSQQALLLNSEAVWFEIKVRPTEVLSVKAAVEYVNTGLELSKKALLLFRGQMADGRLLPKFPAMNYSDLSEASYCYLPSTENCLTQIMQLEVPAGVTTLQIGVQGFFLSAQQQVRVSQLLLDTNPHELISQEVERRTRDLFYNKGAVTAAFAKVVALVDAGISPNTQLNEFKKHIAGVLRLKAYPVLPPKQGCPLYLPQHDQVLYCLHQALPYTSNGYATRSQGIAKGLLQAGFSIRVVARPGVLSQIELSKAEAIRSHQIDGVDYRFYAGSELDKVALDHYLHEAADVFVREAIDCKASVIVAASNHLTAIPALIAARRLGIPFVYEVRGLWELTKASIKPLWQHTERFAIDAGLERFVACEADLVLTLTEELSTELQRRGVAKSAIHLAPNAVDTGFFSPRAAPEKLQQALNLDPNIPVIGYAGSAVAYEGLSLLMQALGLLHQRQQPFQFVLVGDGAVLEQVQADAQKLGIACFCRFAGRVPFEQVPDYIACMDILPIPRLGTAVTELVSALKPLEAMAMAKATVLSNVAPHYTFAGDQQRALLFEKDNASALADTLQRLLCQPALRLQLGEAARQWVCEHRSWQKTTADYAMAVKSLSALQQETPAKPLSDIRLALIADTFSTETLQQEVKCEVLGRETWLQQMMKQPVEALLIESAWEGNGGDWHRAIGYYSEAEFADTRALVAYCKQKAIPVLFWNKEDPVHFERFKTIAALADHVFTSDADCILRYLAQSDHQNISVSSAGFFAAPNIHNPLPSQRHWQHTMAYAGTYYGERYADRSTVLDMMFSTAAPAGLTIYDRQANVPASPYTFPQALQIFSQGALDYSTTVEAYKSHPLQLNVNSVTASATMCSRRVMEIAACGTALISGPGLAIKQLFGDAVYQVSTDQQMLSAANLLQQDGARWQMALSAHRKVMRCHTASQRLSLMLRTAGLNVAPKLPSRPVLVVYDMTCDAARALLKQSLLPDTVLALHWQPEARHQLIAAGIRCDEIPEGPKQWLWAMSSAQLTQMATDDIEDLVQCRLYFNAGNVMFNRDSAYNGGSRGLAGFDLKPDLSLVLQFASFSNESIASIYQTLRQQRYITPGLQLRKARSKEPLVASEGPILLIASHDVKFMRMLWPSLRLAGYRLLLDFWHDHKTHNESRSQALLEQAQLVFCEWLLGNARWYSKHKRADQLLLGRMHAQELNTGYLNEINADNFAGVITVAAHMQQKLAELSPALAAKSVVISNAVDIDRFSLPRNSANGKTLGLVGMVPRMKRFDRALDLLAKLRAHDKDYQLRIKGKQPADFFWMKHRPDELRWYEQQYQRIKDDPLLINAVHFDAQGDDMPKWYNSIDVVLSVSEHESFHYAVAEGVLAGCKPAILSWQGAEKLYPQSWIGHSLTALIERITQPESADIAEERRSYIARHYATENIAVQWQQWLDEIITQNIKTA